MMCLRVLRLCQHVLTRGRRQGEALVWMDKDHPRGTMVIGGRWYAYAKAERLHHTSVALGPGACADGLLPTELSRFHVVY